MTPTFQHSESPDYPGRFTLDHERGAAVIDLITRLTHQQATATVLVTHDRTHLASVDQIAEVRDGRLHLPASTS